MAPKSEQITALALEILEDAEMSRTSVEALVMKASRLARLADDKEAITWLYYERFGYNDSDEISVKYLGLTARWIDIPKKQAYYAATLTHEAIIEAERQKMDVAKAFVPSGEYASMQFHNQQVETAKIANTIFASRRVLSAIRAQVQEFATRIY